MNNGSRIPVFDRVMQKVIPEPNCGCWLFMGALNKGYGQTGMGGKKGRPIGAHIVVYEALVGPIPKGMTIDHKCRVRCCVNPDHLRIMTRGDNVLCGLAPTAINKSKVVCLNGHPLEGANLYLEPKTGYRKCRACRRLRQRGYVQRTQQAKGIVS